MAVRETLTVEEGFEKWHLLNKRYTMLLELREVLILVRASNNFTSSCKSSGGSLIF